ncbi:MAG: Na/Pi cotransporter family protein [Bacteroidetes bacterium]|nr:Na/Pi cotransporter family protein [Bacteroidota bacterium]
MVPDIWKMLAGVAIFMLGMNFLEEGLSHLVGRSFKLFLKKQTSNRFKAVSGGTVVAGILQSSSIVNLIVLAFVGTGVLGIQNALAIILGANLGTTISSWIVATIGFKFSIESFALPITGVFGVLMILSDKDSRFRHWCRMILGFSFLFVGLNFMREGFENAVLHLDLNRINQQPLVLFVLAGFVITAMIQSSSATVAIILSALYVDAISLIAATAVVLGSEAGTAVKLLIASVKGTASKKRVALANFLFNVINVVLLFIFLVPVNFLISEVVGIRDKLIALVFFQSFVNLFSILLFLPFLNWIEILLVKHLSGSEKDTLFIHSVKASDSELALATLERETRYFMYHIARFVLSAFDHQINFGTEQELHKGFLSKNITEKYEFIKQLHGKLYSYTIEMERYNMDKELIIRLQQLISSSRNSMYAAKNLKDALPDIDHLRKSSNDSKYGFYILTREKIAVFYEAVIQLLNSKEKMGGLHSLSLLYSSVQIGYADALKTLYQDGNLKRMNEVEFSTLINFNREMYTLEKSILFALKDFLLHENEARAFDDLPGFIR